MAQSVDFIFDFGSPNVYFVHKVIPDIAARTEATFNYIPCLLGGIFKATNNQAPWAAYANVKGKIDYERLEIARFIKKHSLTAFKFNSHFPVNTLLLMRGAIAADAAGALPAYIEAGMAAMWEQDRNMADPEIYAATMTEAGLDGPALLAATQDPDIKAALAENTAAAVERGAFGAPTFFVGDEMFFGKERLGQIEETLTAAA